MQEIKKRRIVIASVLKPVDDTRMFEKMGITLAPFYEVDIIGYPSIKSTDAGSIHLHALTPFSRLSFGRLLAPFRILMWTLKLKPDLFIITTHELLFAALMVKMLTGAKIIYDVRENYRRNILHTNAFPRVLRPLLALWVMLKEWFGRFYIDHYLLAEEGYTQELFFPAGKFTVLENKFRRPQAPLVRTDRRDGMIRLLFSGTLNEGTGIFMAIDLADKLYSLSNQIRLTILGYCAQEDVLTRIREAILNKDYITLIGGGKLVPHDEILIAIKQSDFGIISYPPNPSTANTIPTKLYEYLGSKLPILLINHSHWATLAMKYDAAVVFDPQNLDPSKILQAMQQGEFYHHNPVDIFWEEERMLGTIANILAKNYCDKHIAKY